MPESCSPELPKIEPVTQRRGVIGGSLADTIGNAVADMIGNGGPASTPGKAAGLPPMPDESNALIWRRP
jgi:hypothetical protein